MKKAIVGVFLVTLLASTNKSLAWGREGHHIISQLAFQMLKPATQEKYLKILNGISVDSAGIWMDAVRGKAPYTSLDVTHYINAEKGEAIDFTATNNVYWELNQVLASLKEKDNIAQFTQQEQVLILTHLVEDLHQPLHVGYGVDRGGNGVFVQYNNKKYNLHALWDYGIIEQTQITKDEVWNSIESMWGCKKKKIQRIDLKVWMNDARTHLDQVYKIENDNIDKKYEKNARKIIKRQLAYAALRLAAAIEQAIG